MADNHNKEEAMNYILNQIELQKEIKDANLKEELRTKFGTSEQERIEIMTMLYNNKLIKMKSIGEDVIYFKHSKTKQNLGKGDKIEKIILEAINNTQNDGITKIELKKLLNLNQKLITNILKKLEKIGYICSYKTKFKNKYMYVSSKYIPDEAIIGGNLYENGEIDNKFINILFKSILDFIKKKNSVYYNELLGYLTSNEGKLLNEKEIKSVINVLLLEKQILKIDDKFVLGNENNFLDDNVENEIPCYKCPVFDSCEVGGLISPENCIYFENW